MTAAPNVLVPGPATAGPGTPRWRRLAAPPGLTALFGRLGMPLFWAALIFFILVPCASSLALALSPRLFDQGSQWFTLTYLGQAFTGSTAVAIANSLWVSSAAAALGLAIGFPVAWLAGRTTLPGRRFVAGSMWLVLLLPSWLPALGWERLVQQDGVMYRVGLDWPWVTHAIMGPFGVVFLLGLRSVPFTFLAITAALAGLGQEFEDAARAHGASRTATLRLIWPMLAPAIWSALAIGFAESISDFGVAATLAYNSNFTLATYQLFAAIGNFPPSFPLASAMGTLLVAAVAIPLALQARALRGRSYQMLSGRTRQVIRRQLSRRGAIAAVTGVGLFYLIALGVPAFGAISASLLGDYGGSFTLTLVNYRALFHEAGQIGPLERSLIYATVTAFITVIGGFIAAWLLAQRRAKSSKALDFLLLAAIALPSVVFAAGYIFAYNLPFWSRLGINLYQTTTLLVIAYAASSLPTNARVLVGAVSQLQPSLKDAARTHGAGGVAAWARGVLPVVSRPIVMAWLLTFCAVFLELPISQLLYAPGSPPASIAIEDNLSNYHFGVGMAQAVFAVGIALAAVLMVLGAYRLAAPAGWRRIGGSTRG
ncbi:MAG TPA: ABC transporter permease subunit [Streptosporangiaceae bacterium]|nr:ABC transporter permease subunit [Streptosporangiaceae bacterium]